MVKLCTVVFWGAYKNTVDHRSTPRVRTSFSATHNPPYLDDLSRLDTRRAGLQPRFGEKGSTRLQGTYRTIGVMADS